MHFTGLNKATIAEANVEAFIEQAIQYKELIEGNKINKAMEFYMFSDITHPLNAVRAYEIKEWDKSKSFSNTKIYLSSKDITTCENLPLVDITDRYIGKDYLFVETELTKIGFSNVELVRKIRPDSKKNEPSHVVEIAINGKTTFEDADWYSRDSIIEVAYYLPESDEEVAAAHPGQIKIPNSSKGYIGINYDDVVVELKELGFTNISTFEQEGKKSLLSRKENCIVRISINGHNQFETGAWFDCDAAIRITYNTFSN